MSNTQPKSRSDVEALRLADELPRYRTVDCCNAAAAELRRLHALNQELLEALKKYHAKHVNTYGLDGAWDEEITLSTKVISKAEAAIAKASGVATKTGENT